MEKRYVVGAMIGMLVAGLVDSQIKPPTAWVIVAALTSCYLTHWIFHLVSRIKS